MKLSEIIMPYPMIEIVEGFKHSVDDYGRHKLDFDPDVVGDDEVMRKRQAGHRTQLVAGGRKVPKDRPTNINTGKFDTHSRKEQHDFEKHRDDDTFHTSFPTFYGYSLDRGKQKTEDREHYMRILDALKGRHGHSISPKAMDHLMTTSAAAVGRQMEGHYNKLRKIKHVVILPMPSSSTIPKNFAKYLKQMFEGMGKNVEIHDVLEQNLNYKMGISGGKNLNPEKLENMYNNIIREFRNGARSEQEALDALEEIEEFLKLKMNDPSTDQKDMALYKKDWEHLQKTMDELLNLADTPELQQERERGNAAQQRVHAFTGGQRRHVYDRIKVKDDHRIPASDEDVLYVLADDNVDQGKTMIDAYRYLYKHGIFNQPNVNVVGAVMHKLGADLKR